MKYEKWEDVPVGQMVLNESGSMMYIKVLGILQEGTIANSTRNPVSDGWIYLPSSFKPEVSFRSVEE